jgi:hypothetical protein
MLEIVILVVASAVVLIGGTALLMFFDVAFATLRRRSATADPGAFQLPLLRGEELRRWAKGMAERVVSKHAGRTRDKQSVLGIAVEVLDGTSGIIYEVTDRTDRPRSRAKSCSARRHEMTGVTAPEVLAIADDLQRSHSKREVDTIRARARENVQRASRLDHTQFPTSNLTCPLYTESGHCATFGSRPLYCRGACPECREGDCRRESHDLPALQAFATTVGEGMLDGLTTGLASAGLDNHVYELNSALSVALSTPDAASRFARGEAVFSGCKPYA